MKKKLLEAKQKETDRIIEDEAIEKLIESSEMDVPDGMIDNEARHLAEDFAQRIQGQGMPFEQYLKYTGMDGKTFVNQMKPQALKRIQSRLVLEAVVKAENIEITPEEVDMEFTTLSEQYKMEKDKIKEMIVGKELDNFKMDIAVGKAATLVREAAVQVEKKEETK